MSTPNDLPWRMSDGQQLDAVQTAATSSVSSGTVSFFTQLFSSHTTHLRRGIVALALPAALLVGAVLADDRQEPDAVSFAVRNADVASVQAADVVVAEVDSTLGQPVNTTSAMVIGSYANLRHGPGYNYAVIGSATYGTTIQPLAKNNGWFKVRTPSGAVVWIVGWLTNISPAVANSLPYEAVGQASPRQVAPASGDVANIALSYVGYPYAYGAAGPGAFDCSGLTQWVYRQVGVWLPHSASGQYGAAGTHVGMNALLPGDLVFFAGTYPAPGITHVAIYVGNGRMVSAGTPATGVTVENIYSGYWISKFVGGLRVAR